MPETLTDAQKVLRNDTGLRMAAALESLASGVEPSRVIAPEYNPAQTYAVGALVMYKGGLYRCTTAIPTPEAWTPGHWAATSVSAIYRQASAQDVIDNGKQAKINVSGLLKGNGSGGVSAAVAGTDYGTYSKPSTGIPKSDLASGVQTSLGKADTALQSVPSTYRTAAAQDVIDAGKQAKINVSGLLKGNGNGSVSAATAGTDYETPAGAKTLGITGAAVGDLVRVAAVDASGKPTSWSHVPLCDIVTNDNWLDNAVFAGGGQLPVNQRGQTTYTNADYTIDRWKLFQTGNFEIVADGVNISTNNTSNMWGQLVANPEALLNKQVCISFIIDGLLRKTTFVMPASIPTGTTTIGSAAVGVKGVNAYLRTINGVLHFLLYASSSYTTGTPVKIAGAKLELGSEQTLAHWDGTAWVLNEIPDYSEELKKCMYYYQRFSGTVSLGYGSMQTVRRASIPVMFPTIIKTPYTFTQSGNAGITYSGGNPIPTVTMNAGSSALAEMYAELPSGAADGSKGECVNLWLRSGAYFEFSAEL